MEIKLSIVFDLEIIKTEDRGGDEPRIQAAFLLIKDGRATVKLADSGLLADSFPNTSTGFPLGRRSRTLENKAVSISYDPVTDGNYIGIVVRAIEEDHSTDSARGSNRRSFRRVIEQVAQEILDAGRIPTVDELWDAGSNQVRLLDSQGVDDDDRIGVSARVYKDAGLLIEKDPQLFERDLEFRFVEDEAHYLLTGKLIAIDNTLM